MHLNSRNLSTLLNVILFKKDFFNLERKEKGEGKQQKEWERKENKEKGSGEVGEGEVRWEGAVDFGESPRTRVKALLHSVLGFRVPGCDISTWQTLWQLRYEQLLDKSPKKTQPGLFSKQRWEHGRLRRYGSQTLNSWCSLHPWMRVPGEHYMDTGHKPRNFLSRAQAWGFTWKGIYTICWQGLRANHWIEAQPDEICEH